ncbi:MAG: response regulator transcription factor [Gemmatimonadaceae bacterium]
MTTMYRGVGDRVGYRIGNGAGFIMPSTTPAGAAQRAPSTMTAPSVAPVAHESRLALRVISGNRLLREALAALLRQQTGFSVKTAAPESIQHETFIPSSSREIAVLEHSSDSASMVALTRRLRDRAPGAGIIVFGIPSKESILPLVEAGIRGFVLEEASSDELVATIGSIAAGRPLALTSQISSDAPEPSAPARPHASSASGREIRLTRRERQIIALLADGSCNKEIASRLGITLHTVKSHVHNLLAKLSVDSRLALAALVRRQVISLEEFATQPSA